MVFSTIADLTGEVCNGGGLQYNTGVLYGQTDFNHKRI